MQTMLLKNRYLAFWAAVVIIFTTASLLPRVGAAETPGTNGVEWKTIIFGQSISSTNNSIEIDKANNTVTLTAGLKDGSAAGGKIAKAHDGISFYYTEIPSTKNFELSAKIKVNFFAKATPDNQEGFGIMARDAIGKDLEATVFPSNMVMVGGYRGVVQSVFRNEVKDASGAGAVLEEPCQYDERPANDGSATYQLKLRKTNTGYHVSVNDKPEKIYYRPKQLEVLNPEKIYIGFFAARVASITVSDIVLKTSDVATDPPGVPEPAKGVVPSASVLSPGTSSLTGYSLMIRTNVKGNLEIRQNGTLIANTPVDGKNAFKQNTTLIKDKNTFDVVFTPDASENVTTTAPFIIKHVVTFKTYGKTGQPIYASPKGQSSATGTFKDPIDIYSAVQFLQPGQTIYVRGGVYNLSAPLFIERGNSGTAAKPKVLKAYAKEKPVFDFGTKSYGFTIAGDYWQISGIDITRALTTGCQVAGNHNRIELVNTYANGDTGLQISSLPLSQPEQWPSNNLILNCTSYDNRDKSENNADGFAAKLTCGAGNVFRGCIAYHNCDDGYDLYSKLETGPIGAVTLENCIAYNNGMFSDGTKTKGDGNGFKLGGEGLAVKHLLRNSLAFKNSSNGVTSNSDPAIIVENTTSVDNGKANFFFANYANATPQFAAKNNISFRTTSEGLADLIPANLVSANNFFYNGTQTVNADGKKLSIADFKSVAPGVFKRDAKGNITPNEYMAPTAKSGINSGFRIVNPAPKPKSTKK
ncbi:MAG TPA: right-handed parallel beta-helix repeat-containing protein [Bacillota bacterium]|nr:right-handed parallel beta-helix repeat-containing protein [Bacillota bacterium]